MSTNAQQAENNIQNNLSEITTWLNQIQSDNQAITNDTNNEATTVNQHTDYWRCFEGESAHYVTANHTKINEDINDINAKNGQIRQLTNQIEGMDSQGQFTGLLSALQSCINAISSSNNEGWQDQNELDLLVANLKNISEYMTQIVTALQFQVRGQFDYEQFQKDLSNGADSSTLSQDAEAMVADSRGVNSALEALVSSAGSNYQNYETDSSNASVDMNGIHWWDVWFGNGAQEESDDNATISNATTMETLLSQIQTQVTPTLASVMNTDMQAIFLLVETMKHEIDELLSSNLNPAERAGNAVGLNAKVMSLFLIVTGLLAIVQVDATKDKSKNEEVMSQASVQAAQTGIQNIQAEQTKIAQDEQYAKAMNVLMSVCQYTMMGLMTILAPGVGSMLMSVLLILLQATGAIGDLTQAIAQKINSQVGADVLVGGLEVVATLGGGAAIDALMTRAMTAATMAINVAITASVKEFTEQVCASAGGAVSKASQNAIKEILEIAANTAAQKTFILSMQQNGFATVLKLMSTSGQQAVKASMEGAAKEAIQNAAEMLTARGSRVLVRYAAEGVLKELDETTAEKIGQKAAATAMRTTEKAAAKGTFSLSISQIIALSIYATTSTNLITDIAKDANADSTVIDVLQVIQQILTMIAEMVGLGVSGQVFNDASTSMSTLMQATSAFNIVPTLGESASNYGLYASESDESSAVSTMGQLQVLVTCIMQVLAPQINKRQQTESESDNQIFMQEMQSVAAVAQNSYSYLQNVAQVLQA